MTKAAFCTLAAVLLPSLALGQGDGVADKYPQRPIRIITGSVGSTSDLSARILGQKLAERWGQQVVVDNRPGAGGIIGTDIAAKSAPDGYTLAIGHVGTHASAPALYSKLPYDPVRDFEPVTNVVNVAIVLVINPSVPASNLKEFVALARSKPGALNNGSPGNGTSGHLTGELFNIVTQTKLLHIPYKGAGPALNAVVMGESHASFLSTATAQGQVKAGRLRALAVLRATRFAGTPDVPSSVEAGFAGLESNAWFGLFAPARTPKPIIAKVNAEVMRTFKSPEVTNMLLAQGAEDATTKPEEFGAYVKSEIAKWGKVVKQSGAKLD
jgi:tripartite-type tricarboxylate transporter receptor subunit TctC